MAGNCCKYLTITPASLKVEKLENIDCQFRVVARVVVICNRKESGTADSDYYILSILTLHLVCLTMRPEYALNTPLFKQQSTQLQNTLH